MESSYQRALMERGPTLSGGFPVYPEQRSRSPSRPGPVTRFSDTTDSISTDRAMPQAKPMKGILKTSVGADPRRAEEPAQAEERSRELLARRFYRVPRPEQLQHAPPHQHHALPMAQLSPQYSSDSDYHHFDTEGDSASSELSVNTQATSVISDDFPPPGKRSAQIQHVRRVPPPTVSRVKPRPRTRPPSDVGTRTSQSHRRTVNIQILPSEKETTKDLQLSRRSERSLLDKISELESEAESLRANHARLSKNLDDASERLSVKEFGNKEIEKALKQERNGRELVLRDLEEQRQMFDEFRSNFELQKGLLQEAESERDSYKKARDKLEAQLGKLSKAAKQRETEQQGQEDLLARQVGAFEKAAAALEKKVSARDQALKKATADLDGLKEGIKEHGEKVKSLTSERDTLRASLQQHEAKAKKLEDQVKTLTTDTTTLQSEKKEIQEIQKKLTATIKTLEARIAEVEGEKSSLQSKVDEVEGEKKDLSSKIEGLEGEVDSLKEQVAAFEPDKQALEKQLEEEKADKETQLSKMNTQLEGSKVANVSLASQRLDLDTKLTKVQGDLEAAQAKVGDLENGNKGLQSTIDELKSRATELEANVAEVEELRTRTADLEKQTGELEALKTRAADLEKSSEELEKLREQHKELEGRAKGLQEKLDSAPAPAGATKDSAADTAAMDKLAEEKAGLEKRIGELQVEVDKISGLEERAKQLQAEAEKVPGLAQQAQSLSAQLATAAQQLEQANSARAHSAAQIHDLQAAVNSLQSRAKSRSGSRRPGREGHTRARSTSMVFVRKPNDKTGAVYVTTREAIAKGE